MNSISAVKARQGLGMLLNRVYLRHESFVIERAGKKIAILKGYEESPAPGREDRGRIAEGKLDIRDMAGLGAAIWKDMNADAYLSAERGEWS